MYNNIFTASSLTRLSRVPTDLDLALVYAISGTRSLADGVISPARTLTAQDDVR